MVEDIKAYESLGVEEVIFDFRARDYGETMARMDHSMTKVVPQVDLSSCGFVTLWPVLRRSLILVP